MFEVKNMNTDEGIDLDNFDKEAEIAKFEGYKPKIYNVAIRLYSPPTQTKGGLIIPDTTRSEVQYHTCVGLVVKIAPGCYKERKYGEDEAACKVGDWVVIPRHSGIRLKYKGLPLFSAKEDAIEAVVDNPLDIER